MSYTCPCDCTDEYECECSICEYCHDECLHVVDFYQCESCLIEVCENCIENNTCFNCLQDI